jgi:hypothetical protein
MTTEKVADEMLMAFADCELEPDAAAEVARLVQADPVLARKVEEFRTTRRLAKQALSGMLSDPVPMRPAATLMRRRPFAALFTAPSLSSLPLAASLALVAGLGGYLIGDRLHPSAGDPLLLAATPDISAVLDRGLTGEALRLPGKGAATALGTFRVGDSVCRSFEVSREKAPTILGLGCHFDDRWEIELAITERAKGESGYAPAAETASASLGTVLESLGAEGPVDTAMEQQLRDRGWRP